MDQHTWHGRQGKARQGMQWTPRRRCRLLLLQTAFRCDVPIPEGSPGLAETCTVLESVIAPIATGHRPSMGKGGAKEPTLLRTAGSLRLLRDRRGPHTGTTLYSTSDG